MLVATVLRSDVISWPDAAVERSVVPEFTLPVKLRVISSTQLPFVDVVQYVQHVQ